MAEESRRQPEPESRSGAFWVAGIYLGWVTLHYAAAHAYARICTPPTIYGFLASPFVTTTPPCSGLRWAISSGADAIGGMWAAAGSFVLMKSGLNSLRRRVTSHKNL